MAQTTADDLTPGAAPEAERLSPLDWRLDLTRVSWEAIAWALTLPLALLLRVVWLHGWPLHPAEGGIASAAHALLVRGEVAAAPPVEAGPVVTLLTSFLMFLVTSTDDSARLGAALAGAGTVAACWWLRPFLGRVGALAAAVLLTWSPLALYESRRLSPETFAAFFLLVLAICLLRLRSGMGGRATLLTAAVAGTLAVFSHYLALPIALFLLALTPLAARMAIPAPAPAAKTARTAASPPPAVPAESVPLPTPITQRDWLLVAAMVGGLTLLLALLAATGGSDLLVNLLSPLTAWTGVAPSVERPPLFLPLLLLVYEPLLLIGALAGAWTVGGGRETLGQRTTGLLVVLWATGALLLAALAGDRDPAQALYPLVPLALLGGRVLGDLLTGLPWDAYRRGRGPILSGVSALAIVAVIVFLATLTAPVTTGPDATRYAITLLLDFIIGLLLIGATIYLIRPLGYGVGLRTVAVTTLAFLALYGVRSATQLAYVQPAVATELAVQGQTAPGVASVVERIERLSRDLTGVRRNEGDTTGGHSMEIALDRALEQPFRWYLRDYTNVSIFDPAGGALPGNPQLVLVAAGSEPALRAPLERGYVGQRYPFAWSFPTTGLGGGVRGTVRYLLYREPATPPVAADFALHLRRDVAERVLFRGDGLAAGGTPTQTVGLFDRAGRGRAPGQLDAPRGIATDRQGNIYVVDTVNARVQKFDEQGVHQWSAGSTGSGPGQFARVQNGPGPTGIAVDGQGFLYVADTWNHRIVKLDPTGKFVTAWGGFVNTNGDAEQARQHPREFYGPRSIAIGPDGAIYVTDTGNKRVLVFDASGQPLRQWGGMGSGPANLNEPVGIAVDETGTVYVADTYNGRIATFDGQGKPIAQWPVPGWGNNIYQEPYIAVAGDTVYVTNTPGRALLRFDKGGRLLGEERRPGNVELLTPTGVAVQPDGTVLIVDTGAHMVVRAR